jgi:hypothetical protein
MLRIFIRDATENVPSPALVDSVEPLGVFTALDVPDRFGPTWSQRK